MIKAQFQVKLPASVKEAVARLAREDDVSINQWMSTAIAQKVDLVEAGTLFLKRRALPAKRADILLILDNAGREPPPPGDEL
jgi:hypothetical protein